MTSIRESLTSAKMWFLLACMVFVVSAQGVEGQLVPPELTQRAAVEGTVPVIVRLAMAVTPEGILADKGAVLGQRQGIANRQRAVLAALIGHGHRMRHRYETVPFLALEVGPAALAVLNSLIGTVLRIEEDAMERPLLAESVPLVQGNAAWNVGFTGRGKVIAVLDSGIDKAHPFLAGKVVEEACFSANGNCPNGSIVQTGNGAGVPCTDAPSDCQHGTHVAGIAAGSGASFSGVAKDASLMSVQVFSRFTGVPCIGTGEDPCEFAFVSDQLAGLEHIYTLRNVYSFASVNISIGGGSFSSNCDSDARKMAIDNLRSVGIATVVASGNEGQPRAISAPACISTAVSVGSTDDGSLSTTTDAISPFSNSAPFLSLLAPGRWINSSIPGGGFTNFGGTSMAAPHVAGAWAILKQADPSADVSKILKVLQSTGLPINDVRNGITKSRIRIFKALRALGALAPPPSDYDGDGLTDIAVYRPSTGIWYIINSTGGLRTQPWGVPGDIPVPGDYDGDGLTDIAVYRPSTGIWYIINSTGGLRTQPWGVPEDIPVPGDYDGDGLTDIAVYRPSTGIWYIINSTGGLRTQPWGVPEDIPVPGDYDGDGLTDIAVYRPSTGIWYIINSTGGLRTQPWGVPGDIPVPGDYDGDGLTDIAVYRPSTGIWYIINSTGGLRTQPWGVPGDIPVPGDYDGDGLTDIAIYRPSTGIWYIINSTGGLRTQQWGVGGDQPLTGRF